MKFENQTFTTDVTLDYNEFIDCEIKNCKLLYRGGEYSLVRTKLSNIQFALGGSANNTLSFLRLIRANGPHLLEDLLNQGPQPKPAENITIN